MKKKRLLATFAAIAAIASIYQLAKRYNVWRNAELARLSSASRAINTALGPIEYTIEGSGPAILVSHGTPGGYDQAIALARLIGPGYTLIAPSRPGYLSTPLSSGSTPEQQADLFAALLDALNIPQTAIIGISGGGPSALQFALRHPERCISLIAASAITRQYSDTEERRSWSIPHRLFKQSTEKLFFFEPLHYLILSIARHLPDHIAPDDLLRANAMQHLRAQGYSNDMHQFAVMPPYPLKDITVPVAIIHGTADDDVPYSHAVLLAQQVQQSVLHSIAGGDHNSFFTHKETLMPSIREFLQQSVYHSV